MSFENEVSELERLLEADGFIKFWRMGPLYDIEEADTSDAAMIRKPTRLAKVLTAPRRAPHGSDCQQGEYPRFCADYQAGGELQVIRDGRGRATEESTPN